MENKPKYRFPILKQKLINIKSFFLHEFPHSWDFGFRDISNYPLFYQDLSDQISLESNNFPERRSRRLLFFPGLSHVLTELQEVFDQSPSASI